MQHNGPMQISTRHSYQADIDTVIAMMADEVWLSAVARHAGADRWQVSSGADGSHVEAELAAPQKAVPFTGPTLKVKLDMFWPPSSNAGTRDGRIEVHIPGMPATMIGTGRMVSNGGTTDIDYDADFTIKLPLIGRGLEAAAAPYVRRVIDTQQQVGNDYLAGRLA